MLDHNSYMREYLLQNKERINAQRRKRHLLRKKIVNSQNSKSYYKHKEKRLQECEMYRKNNPEKVHNAIRKCWAINKEKYRSRDKTVQGRFSYSRSDAKRRDLEFSLSFSQYSELISRPCFYCQNPLNPTSIGLDRKDNSQGYTIENVVPCCKSCNLIRGRNLSVQEMQVAMEAILKFRRKLVA